MKKWNLIVNVGRCENCLNCVIATKDETLGNDFPGYSAAATPSTDNTVRILRRVQGSAPMVETTYLPVMCNHCDDAPCLKAGADAILKRNDGIVVIDPVKAKGRKDIVKSCPYGAIVWNEEQQLPQTWFFDAHLLDGGWQQPRCQQVCPTDVFETVKLNDRAMAEMARKEELDVLLPQIGTKPRVWYRGFKRWTTCFIGGNVCASLQGQMECIQDAHISLVKDGSILATTTSDGFGDFKFSGLPKESGDYKIEIKHQLGSAAQICTLIESVYLGDVMLTLNTP